MYEWHCQKLQKLGVGVAVYRKDWLQKYTSNPIPSSFFKMHIDFPSNLIAYPTG